MSPHGSCGASISSAVEIKSGALGTSGPRLRLNLNHAPTMKPEPAATTSTLVTRAEFARIAGVSAAAVTKACRRRLAPACVGRRVALEHPAASAYLAARGSQGPRHRRFIDLDSPATAAVLTRELGRPCTAADLDRIWTEHQEQHSKEMNDSRA